MYHFTGSGLAGSAVRPHLNDDRLSLLLERAGIQACPVLSCPVTFVVLPKRGEMGELVRAHHPENSGEMEGRTVTRQPFLGKVGSSLLSGACVIHLQLVCDAVVKTTCKLWYPSIISSSYFSLFSFPSSLTAFTITITPLPKQKKCEV